MSRALSLSLAAALWFASAARAATLPPDFEELRVVTGLVSPATLRFAPDGRMFVGERIQGRLLVGHYDGATASWVLNPQPFHVFGIPKDGSGTPLRHRSAGLRDIVFDPDFADNGWIYVVFLKHQILHNRVVRLRAGADPDVADPASETLLLEMPFSPSTSSGSHNGGALEFGTDGRLYITTGDGWNGGDDVQSLTTFTGKVFRIDADGTIPSDNPFFTQTTGDYRAIYALGLRNPYSMSRHPASSNLYINETTGPSKGEVFALEAAGNYGHDGYGGIGNERFAWANAAVDGGSLTTGGVWYPAGGPFPVVWHGRYLVALWGPNNNQPGRIAWVQSEVDTTVGTFASDVVNTDRLGQALKPVLTRIGPDGNLYYVLTTYQTADGSVEMVRWTGCDQPRLGPARRLLAWKDGGDAVRFAWTADAGGSESHVNEVGAKTDLVGAGPHRRDRPGGLADPACDASRGFLQCSDADALTGAARVTFYRALAACGPDGVDEGPPE